MTTLAIITLAGRLAMCSALLVTVAAVIGNAHVRPFRRRLMRGAAWAAWWAAVVLALAAAVTSP